MGNLAFQELLFLLIPLLILYLVIKAVIKLFNELIVRRRRYEEAKIRLLMHIAAKQGVDQDKIAEIVAEAELPNFANK